MDALRPQLRLADPHAATALIADPACAQEVNAANQLHHRIAVRRAATAARLLLSLFPTAEHFTVHRRDDGDGLEYTPASIRDADGRLLWFNASHFGDEPPEPDDTGRDDHTRPASAALAGRTDALPYVEPQTIDAISTLIDVTDSWDPAILDPAGEYVQDDLIDDGDLRVLRIRETLTAAAQLDVCPGRPPARLPLASPAGQTDRPDQQSG
ncbi:hypothetical protein [Nucisporomicrobium flavum]|uniref:hypothetical protein n=1 Tax=Nucisporomicrobium flavum TaxID=2785915 RepID=UPI0018F7121C|nr:hypothetical protein [Nucisporomicrobium flavum]